MISNCTQSQSSKPLVQQHRNHPQQWLWLTSNFFQINASQMFCAVFQELGSRKILWLSIDQRHSSPKQMVLVSYQGNPKILTQNGQCTHEYWSEVGNKWKLPFSISSIAWITSWHRNRNLGWTGADMLKCQINAVSLDWRSLFEVSEPNVPEGKKKEVNVPSESRNLAWIRLVACGSKLMCVHCMLATSEACHEACATSKNVARMQRYIDEGKYGGQKSESCLQKEESWLQFHCRILSWMVLSFCRSFARKRCIQSNVNQGRRWRPGSTAASGQNPWIRPLAEKQPWTKTMVSFVHVWFSNSLDWIQNMLFEFKRKSKTHLAWTSAEVMAGKRKEPAESVQDRLWKHTCFCFESPSFEHKKCILENKVSKEIDRSPRIGLQSLALIVNEYFKTWLSKSWSHQCNLQDLAL